MIQADYNSVLYRPGGLLACISETVAALEPFKDRFDFIAFRGTSGAMIAPAVAAFLDKPFTLVRKDDGHHSGYDVCGYFGGTYIILDDFIQSGDTVRAIQKEIVRVCPPYLKTACVGFYLYSPGQMVWRWNSPDYQHHFHTRWPDGWGLPVWNEESKFVADPPEETILCRYNTEWEKKNVMPIIYKRQACCEVDESLEKVRCEIASSSLI